MTKKRTIGTLAALGGFTAAVALLAGAPAAKADELSDLRANHELLQGRLDQLAQAARVSANPYGVGGPAGPTTVQVMGGSFPRSFLIPGTQTSIRVGGELRHMMLYWINGGAPNQRPLGSNTGATGQAAAIPIFAAGRSRAEGVFNQTAQQSKLLFESRTPTAWGQARTVIEFDFAGGTFSDRTHSISTSLVPRLRYAYGTFGGLLFGQANSNFSDSDANQETLNFGGNIGNPGVVRLPQVRYTMPMQPWGLLGAFSVSAEVPETNAWLPGAGITASDGPSTISGFGPTGAAATITNPLKAAVPDLTAAWYIPQAWGHVSLSGVFRPALQIKDGVGVNQRYLGYGGHFGGSVRPGLFGERNVISWHVLAGEGLGRYANSATSFDLVSNYTQQRSLAGTVITKPVKTWAGNVGYRHFWAPNVRSNISGGVQHNDIDGLNGVVCPPFNITVFSVNPPGGCNLNKRIYTANANVIWNPVPFVDFGVEYSWARRVTFSGHAGNMNAIVSRMRINF
jgi:hypothetical protein